MDQNWNHLVPKTIEVNGVVTWNQNRRHITIKRQISDIIPVLKHRGKDIFYKMEVFLSKEEFREKVERILKGEEEVPIFLRIKEEL